MNLNIIAPQHIIAYQLVLNHVLSLNVTWCNTVQPATTLFRKLSPPIKGTQPQLNPFCCLYQLFSDLSKHLKGRSEPRVRHVFDSEGRSGPRDPASDTFLTRKVVRDPASDTFLTRNFRDPASDTFLTRNFRDPRPSFELAKIIFAPSKIIF